MDDVVRLWGNNVLTQVINTRFGTALTDTQNGFRALRANAVSRLALTEDRHSIELEMVLRALDKRGSGSFRSGRPDARRPGESSLSVVRQTPTSLWCLLRNTGSGLPSYIGRRSLGERVSESARRPAATRRLSGGPRTSRGRRRR